MNLNCRKLSWLRGSELNYAYPSQIPALYPTKYSNKFSKLRVLIRS
jgi:hypothetical protein